MLVTSTDALTSIIDIDSVLTNTVITNEKEYYEELRHSSSSTSSSDEEIEDNEDFTTLILKNMTIKTHLERD
ncbi:hypothetical protein ACI65C_000199 [Semiaphis heraclei]